MKLALNTWLAFEVEAVAETAAVAARLGVDVEALADAAWGNSLASPLATAKLARIADEDYRADFSLAWALKDLDLVAAAVSPGHAPIARAIAKRWRGLVADGVGDLDVAAARLGLDDDAMVAAGAGTTGTARS